MEEEDGGRKMMVKDAESDEAEVCRGRGQEHSVAGCAARTVTGGSIAGKNSEGLFLVAPRTVGRWSAKITAGMTEKAAG